MSNDQPDTQNDNDTTTYKADVDDPSTSTDPSRLISGSEGKRLQAPSWAEFGGLVAAVAAVLALLRTIRLRRHEPTTNERLAEAAQSLGSAAAGLSGRAAKKAVGMAEPVAQDATALAAGAASGAAGLAVGGARKVADVATDGVRGVADGVEAVQNAWNKLVTRLTIVVFGSAGYVLGARAGRERYDQIMGVARRAQHTVQGGSR